MYNLRLYNNLASYSADVTRKYPTVSAINEGRGSIRYIRKIASDTSNLPLMNLARAAKWVASDATYMTNEDAEKVTDITVSKGAMVEGYVLNVNNIDDEVIVELVDSAYTGTWQGYNIYLTASSGECALYGTSSFDIVTITNVSDATTTVNVDGTDYTGYVYSVVTPDGNKDILLVDGGIFRVLILQIVLQCLNVFSWLLT